MHPASVWWAALLCWAVALARSTSSSSDDECPRVSAASLAADPQRFEREFVSRSRPVLITNGAAAGGGWPAARAAADTANWCDARALARRFGAELVTVSLVACRATATAAATSAPADDGDAGPVPATAAVASTPADDGDACPAPATAAVASAPTDDADNDPVPTFERVAPAAAWPGATEFWRVWFGGGGDPPARLASVPGAVFRACDGAKGEECANVTTSSLVVRPATVAAPLAAVLEGAWDEDAAAYVQVSYFSQMRELFAASSARADRKRLFERCVGRASARSGVVAAVRGEGRAWVDESITTSPPPHESILVPRGAPADPTSTRRRGHRTVTAR